MGSLFVLPRFTPINGSGRPYSGCKLYIYRASTSTLASVYEDSGLSSYLTNPVVADSNGQLPAIYLDPNTGYNYRVVLKTSADVELWSEDDVPVNPVTADSIGRLVYPRTAGEIAALVTPSAYQYPPGDYRRYGSTYTADDAAAFADTGVYALDADTIAFAANGLHRGSITGNTTETVLDLRSRDASDTGDVAIKFTESDGTRKGYIGFTASVDDTFSILSYEDHRLKFRTGNGDGSTFYNRMHVYGSLDTSSWVAVESPRADNVGGCFVRFVQADQTAKGLIGYGSTTDNDIDILNQVSGGNVVIDTTAGVTKLQVDGTEVARFDKSTTAGQTRFMLYDVDNGTLERVTVGAADSGGVGYKVLRIPN